MPRKASHSSNEVTGLSSAWHCSALVGRRHPSSATLRRQTDNDDARQDTTAQRPFPQSRWIT